MGAAQYLRDFRRAHNLKKSAELRKRVLQRQEKRKEQSDSVCNKVYMYPKNFMNIMVNLPIRLGVDLVRRRGVQSNPLDIKTEILSGTD